MSWFLFSGFLAMARQSLALFQMDLGSVFIGMRHGEQWPEDAADCPIPRSWWEMALIEGSLWAEQSRWRREASSEHLVPCLCFYIPKIQEVGPWPGAILPCTICKQSGWNLTNTNHERNLLSNTSPWGRLEDISRKEGQESPPSFHGYTDSMSSHSFSISTLWDPPAEAGLLSHAIHCPSCLGYRS